MSEPSELKVMKSAAGWYIGREQDGMPYSRCSPYYPTREKAESMLPCFQIDDELFGDEL